ncbi:MAG: hypothetical protein K6G63_08395 [Eubacterium sp.]|nr:hypothetical protein [Eubacterium sp.]
MGSYRVVEFFIRGKHKSQEKCEDGLVINENLVAVIDGVTAKGSKEWNGMSGGRYAMKLLSDYMSQDVSKLALTSSKDFFYALDRCIKEATSGISDLALEDIPRAAVIVYVPSKQEIWSYGDCRCIVGGQVYTHEKIVDQINAEKRANVLEIHVSEGHSKLIKNDVGRQAILEDLKKQYSYENRHCFVDGQDFGYPVLNGMRICEDMIKEYSVAEGEIIVLASDGYPFLKDSLEQSEAELARLLEDDPLCYKIYKSTKGLTEGAESFDDRTYVKISVL